MTSTVKPLGWFSRRHRTRDAHDAAKAARKERGKPVLQTCPTCHRKHYGEGCGVDHSKEAQ